MKRAVYIIWISTLLFTNAYANNKSIDSIKSIINNPKTADTSVARAYIDLAGYYYISNPDTAILICKTAAELSEKINYSHGMGQAYGWLGYLLDKRGEIDSSITYHRKSLVLFEKMRDTLNLATSLANIGYIYKQQGDIIMALKQYMYSLDLFEKIGNKERVGGTLNNIGQIYAQQGDYEKALETFNKALPLFEELENKYWIALVNNNIGLVYRKKGNTERALNNYFISLKNNKLANNPQGIALSCNNIGSSYVILNKNDSAEKYFQLSLKNNLLVNNAMGISLSKANLAGIYHRRGNYSKALIYAKESMQLAEKTGYLKTIKDAAEFLYKIYKSLGRNKAAMENYELYIQMRDSIENEENQKEVIHLQYKYEYEKQAAADSVKAAEAAKVKDAQLATQKAENARQQQQAYYLYGGLALALLFGGFIFNRFRVTRKQKQVIEYQKEVVEEKNREIIDSINYAKRLQEAILPPTKVVKQYLADSFILYKPKDIVAGDFYWMETLSDVVYFSAADCTGHGVPGAMVSVVCSNALSKALIEENITDVGKLLDRTRELVVERFGRSEENIQDGMDLALCALNTKTNELHYAGANNPLWVIRKGASEVEETKADKQPIGKYDKEDPFTTHTLQLSQGDSLYIFSDGYPDQFGGDRGKKYKTGAMKKFLLSIQDKDMTSQRQLLNEEFENWKGELEQIDDVCVVGVRI